MSNPRDWSSEFSSSSCPSLRPTSGPRSWTTKSDGMCELSPPLSDTTKSRDPRNRVGLNFKHDRHIVDVVDVINPLEACSDLLLHPSVVFSTPGCVTTGPGSHHNGCGQAMLLNSFGLRALHRFMQTTQQCVGGHGLWVRTALRHCGSDLWRLGDMWLAFETMSRSVINERTLLEWYVFFQRVSTNARCMQKTQSGRPCWNYLR